ncbi:MAG: thiamine pyrophosphate-binding protein [Bacteroidia bacterium]|nr:thiamine pyrophosphate-binding protein [Bacteroidia bacterium]
MKIADYIASQLFKEGIKYVFGIPGGPSIPYMEAFRNAGIEFILTSNEASAGIMADVSARLSGLPGVCHATFGPGATNIATGIGGALLDRSPVIVMTSEINDRMICRTTQMNINHQKLFEPITKATFRLNAGNAGEVLHKAFKICREEYPGPVHIGLPSDIAGIEMEDLSGTFSDSSMQEHNNDTEKIASLLAESRRPLLAIGLTAMRLGIRTQLLSFLETYKIPVVITPMAKGVLPEQHPSYTGVLFHALSDYLGDIFEKTDLIIGLGYDPVEYNYESWMPDVPLIHFNTTETDLPSGNDVLQYTGPPDEWFSILSGLNAGSLIFEQAAVMGIRDEISLVFEGFTNHFGPVMALKILQEELPDDSIITADVGSHVHLAGQMWKTGSKGNFIMSNGWSGMGFGIPAALAARLTRPASTVACITGDGGFLMSAGELVTARRYNLPVIIIVLSDGELNLIKLKQSWKDLPAYGTVLYHGDLFGSDVFLGSRVLKADSDESMRKAVAQALSMKEPVIINALIDPDDYKWLVVKQ